MYTFNRTESNFSVAEEYETRAMLYLMNSIEEKKLDDIFLVDMFNDISASRLNFEYIIDAQVKGHKDFGPSKIGESLITLFNNHLSDINFNEYILFCKTVEDKFLIRDKLPSQYSKLKIEDFNEKSRTKILNKLNETIDKEYGENYHKSIERNIYTLFFDNLSFVVGTSKKYINVINSTPISEAGKLEPIQLEKIFDEVTDMRVALKKINIEGANIKLLSDCLNYKKHITRRKIESLIISRVVGYDLFNGKGSSLPIRFSKYVEDLEIEQVKDLIQQVNVEITRAFFNINNPIELYNFLDFVIEKIQSTVDVEIIYIEVVSFFKKIPDHLTVLSAKYLISMILGGYYDN